MISTSSLFMVIRVGQDPKSVQVYSIASLNSSRLVDGYVSYYVHLRQEHRFGRIDTAYPEGYYVSRLFDLHSLQAGDTMYILLLGRANRCATRSVTKDNSEPESNNTSAVTESPVCKYTLVLTVDINTFRGATTWQVRVDSSACRFLELAFLRLVFLELMFSERASDPDGWSVLPAPSGEPG